MHLYFCNKLAISSMTTFINQLWRALLVTSSRSLIKIWNRTGPSATYLVILSWQAIRLVSYDLPLINLCWLFMIIIFVCPETSSSRTLWFSLGLNQADQLKVTQLDLFWPFFADGCKICLFLVVNNLPWCSWPFRDGRDRPHMSTVQFASHP